MNAQVVASSRTRESERAKEAVRQRGQRVGLEEQSVGEGKGLQTDTGGCPGEDDDGEVRRQARWRPIERVVVELGEVMAYVIQLGDMMERRVVAVTNRKVSISSSLPNGGVDDPKVYKWLDDMRCW